MSAPPQEKKMKMNDDVDGLQDEITALKQTIVSRDKVIASKNEIIALVEEVRALQNQVISAQDNEIAALTSQIRAAQLDKEIEESRAKYAAQSLVATLFQDSAPVPPLACVRKIRLSTESHHYAVANAQTQPFQIQYLYPALTNELKQYNLKLEEHPSNIILSLDGTMLIENYTGIQMTVRSTLSDVVYICNQMITTIAKAHDLPCPVHLYATFFSTLFSNINDHIFIKDATSGIPILSVDPRMFLIDQVAEENGQSNDILSKCLDHLLSMRLMGHPCPFGALTCHNLTRVTWLGSPLHREIIFHHKLEGYNVRRLLKIIQQLAGHPQSVERPATLKVSKSTSISHRTCSYINSSARSINISELSYSQDKMIDLFVNAVFCSLEGFAQPRNIIRWEENEEIVFQDAVGLTKDTHVWTDIATVHKGPLTLAQRRKDKTGVIYLVSYVGYGASSKVYRGVTQSGHGCVVKVYVPFSLEMDDDEFEKYSKDMAKKEEANYKEIYGRSGLKNYVWRETLNNMQCIILPFFEPVDVEKQSNEDVLTAIKEQLHQFGKAGKLFRKCDQSWRHVGYFQNQIYLYDLGHLIDMDHPPSDDEDYEYDTEDVKRYDDIQSNIANHMARLSKETAKSKEDA